jgi:hypothetical protein
MTASELRVGNWVKCKTTDGYKFGKICDILDIGYFAARCDGVEYRGKFGNIGVDIESAEPIELTDELLEKCGFAEPCDELYEHENGKFEIAKEQCKWWVTWNGGAYFWFDIKYLHQLQNAYYMVTGEELNIEL